jgi:hypothetical protein
MTKKKSAKSSKGPARSKALNRGKKMNPVKPLAMDNYMYFRGPGPASS